MIPENLAAFEQNDPRGLRDVVLAARANLIVVARSRGRSAIVNGGLASHRLEHLKRRNGGLGKLPLETGVTN